MNVIKIIVSSIKTRMINALDRDKVVYPLIRYLYYHFAVIIKNVI